MNITIPLDKAKKDLENVLAFLQKGETATLTDMKGLPAAILISLREMYGMYGSGQPDQVNQNSADIARQLGLLAELPSEESILSEMWRSLSTEEKERILDDFYNIPLDRSLSDIIIENRR